MHNRRSIRLPGYDYSQDGAYFITICTQNRENLFGGIIGGKMILNDIGKIIEIIWNDLPQRFPIELDTFQIMPNHIHGIIQIVGAHHDAPLQKIWQRNYYEHIILNDSDLEKIRYYIKLNPQNWDRDKNNIIYDH